MGTSTKNSRFDRLATHLGHSSHHPNEDLSASSLLTKVPRNFEDAVLSEYTISASDTQGFGENEFFDAAWFDTNLNTTGSDFTHGHLQTQGQRLASIGPTPPNGHYDTTSLRNSSALSSQGANLDDHLIPYPNPIRDFGKPACMATDQT